MGNGERKEHFKELLISEDVLPEPCQNLCASLLTENKRPEGVLGDSCCRATQRHRRTPISDADRQGKRKKNKSNEV